MKKELPLNMIYIYEIIINTLSMGFMREMKSLLKINKILLNVH